MDPAPRAIAFLPSSARVLAVAILAALLVFPVPPPAPVEAHPHDGASAVIAAAKSHLGAPWRYGQTGPYSFDCSGLLIHVFRETGYYSRIGSGAYRSARAMYGYFRSRGLATRTGGRPGDLVVWGSGSHIGIYLGNGYAISTLTTGVKIHGVHAVTASFTAYLRTGLSTTTTAAAAAPAPAPAAGAITRYTTVNLNLRTGAGTTYRRLTVLPPGTRLSVARAAYDANRRVWYNVRTATRLTGWVASWYTRA